MSNTEWIDTYDELLQEQLRLENLLEKTGDITYLIQLQELDERFEQLNAIDENSIRPSEEDLFI